MQVRVILVGIGQTQPSPTQLQYIEGQNEKTLRCRNGVDVEGGELRKLFLLGAGLVLLPEVDVRAPRPGFSCGGEPNPRRYAIFPSHLALNPGVNRQSRSRGGNRGRG